MERVFYKIILLIVVLKLASIGLFYVANRTIYGAKKKGRWLTVGGKKVVICNYGKLTWSTTTAIYATALTLLYAIGVIIQW